MYKESIAIIIIFMVLVFIYITVHVPKCTYKSYMYFTCICELKYERLKFNVSQY